MKIDDVVAEFETKTQNSVAFRFRHEREDHKQLMLKARQVSNIDIAKFLKQYRKSKNYPQDRLEKLAYILMDIKLQMYLIEVDLGADNDLMRNISGEPDSVEKEAHTQFVHLSFDQSLILKSRILWERVMNFVYYLETGKELTVKKGKKAKFFKFIDDTRWKYLEDFKEYVEWFDNTWRTPEAHKGSKLRARLLSGTMDNDEVNRILGLIGIVTNAFYINMMNIIDDKDPTYRFWTYGMSDDKKLGSTK
jgi:hypothetical protein